MKALESQMPNRIIREGWIDSLPIDSISVHAERFFLRLCLKADDFGLYHAMPQLLKSTLFPLKEDVRNADISHWLAECEKVGLVRCFEHASKRYLTIPNFRQRIRDGAESKFPLPPDMPLTVTRPSHDGGNRPYSESESESKAGSESTRGLRPSARSPVKASLSERVKVDSLLDLKDRLEAVRNQIDKLKTPKFWDGSRFDFGGDDKARADYKKLKAQDNALERQMTGVL